MNVAKWLLLGLLALPLAELAVFVAVAAAIDFLPALALLIGMSVAGGLILRRAGGNHVQRMRGVMAEGLNRQSFTTLQADGIGGLTLLGGLLLAIPGFVTGAVGLLVLLVPLSRRIREALGRTRPVPRADGIVDLEPEQWRRVDDPALPGRGPDGAG